MARYRRFKADRMKDIIKEFKISKATTYSGRKYNLFLFDYGYKSNLFALAKSGGLAVLIFPLLIFIKKMAGTTYCGPPFILFFKISRYIPKYKYVFMCCVGYIKI